MRELAQRYVRGEIFTSLQVHENDTGLIGIIFMPILFLQDKQAKELREHPPHMLWGEMRSRFPQSVNGYPQFSEIGILYKQDESEFRRLVKAMRAALEAVR